MTTPTGNLSTEEWATLLMGEALLFDLLGRVLYVNPSRDWIQPLIEDELFDSSPFAEDHDDVIQGLALLEQWTRSLDGTLPDAEIANLRGDYTRLFVGDGPMQVPPWESVYFSEERLLFQDETTDVSNWFKRFDIQIATTNKEPEDHIAFELSFIAHCAGRTFQAAEEGDASAFAEILAAQRAFLEDHLLRWGIKWADMAFEYAHTDFYRGLALLTRGGLKELSRVFDIDVSRTIRYPGLGTD